MENHRRQSHVVAIVHGVCFANVVRGHVAVATK